MAAPRAAPLQFRRPAAAAPAAAHDEEGRQHVDVPRAAGLEDHRRAPGPQHGGARVAPPAQHEEQPGQHGEREECGGDLPGPGAAAVRAERPGDQVHEGELRLGHRRIDGRGGGVVHARTRGLRVAALLREEPVVAQPRERGVGRGVAVRVDAGGLHAAVPGVPVEVVGRARRREHRHRLQADGAHHDEQHRPAHRQAAHRPRGDGEGQPAGQVPGQEPDAALHGVARRHRAGDARGEGEQPAHGDGGTRAGARRHARGHGEGRLHAATVPRRAGRPAPRGCSAIRKPSPTCSAIRKPQRAPAHLRSQPWPSRRPSARCSHGRCPHHRSGCGRGRSARTAARSHPTTRVRRPCSGAPSASPSASASSPAWSVTCTSTP